IIDYSSKTISFKKNKHFQDDFSYNKSGIELEQKAVRLVKQKDYNYIAKADFSKDDNNVSKTTIVLNASYKLALQPAYSIVELREGSPAEKAGLMLGDVLVSINNKSTDRYSLQEISHMFYDKHGQRIKLEVEREGVALTFVLYLEDVFEKQKNLEVCLKVLFKFLLCIYSCITLVLFFSRTFVLLGSITS